MSPEQAAALQALAFREKMLGKGFLGLALVITDRAKRDGLPIDASTMRTAGGGQVRGAGGGAVKKILERHGVQRRLSSEGGRTSRGTPAKTEAYVGFLNDHAGDPAFDLDAVECFWIARVNDFFAAQPFSFALGSDTGVRGAVRALIAKVEARQRETPGSTIVGAVVQHLIGAKLEVRLDLSPGDLARHGASVNDAASRGGDLEWGDTVIHVTTAPGEPLIEKCRANLDGGSRPIIITSRGKTAVAEGLLDNAGLAERVDVLDYEQFLTANIFEIGRFDAAGRRSAVVAILDRYNDIVERVETDPGLRIVLT